MEYKELRFREQKVFTGRQLDQEGLAVRMAETQHLTAQLPDRAPPF